MARFWQCRRLAPAEEPPEEATAQDKHPQPAGVATIEEVQRDLLEAEAEVRQLESREAAELETEVDGEMQQLIAKHKQPSAAVADMSATTSAMEREVDAGATGSPEGVIASHSSLASQTEAQVKHARVLATVLEASAASAQAARNHPSSRATPVGDADELESENTNTSAESEEDSEDVEDSEEVNRQVEGKDNGVEEINDEREKAERTVGGGASEGRKPPV